MMVAMGVVALIGWGILIFVVGFVIGGTFGFRAGQQKEPHR